MKNLLYFLVILVSIKSYGQGFSDEKVSLTNFIKRMYSAAPFEGVKVVEDYDHRYLVSVISLDKAKYSDVSIMNRLAQIKAQSQVNTFINGASTSSEIIIKTTETKESSEKTKTLVETIESIKQNAVGFSRGLEMLTNFENPENKKTVFIYFREVTDEK